MQITETSSPTPGGLPERTSEMLAKQPQGVRKAVFLEIADRGAHDQLYQMLDTAVRALRTVGPEPVIVAASQNRFNDAGFDRNWQVLRIADQVYEKSEYWHTDAQAPEDIEAWKVLRQLEKSLWRQTFSRAFDLNFGDHILALVLQDGLPWLVFSSSNGYEDHLFELWRDTDITYFGCCTDRFDQSILSDMSAQPLKFELAINPPEFWPYSPVTEGHFRLALQKKTVAKEDQKQKATRLKREPSDLLLTIVAIILGCVLGLIRLMTR